MPVARLIYFLKLPSPDGNHRRGFAERICPLAAGFRAEAVAVPRIDSAANGRRILRHRLADRDCTGHWHRVLRPDWFEPEGAAEPSSGRPEAQRRQGAQLLCTTALGRLCAHPEVRLALAQDRLATELAPALAMPDFLAHEDELGRSWAAVRPEAAASARAAAAAMAVAEGGSNGFARGWRRRIRLAALRRIDAAAVGREVFAPAPELLGEPYAAIAGPKGWTIKAGAVHAAHYWPDPESERRSEAARADEELVQAFERILCPWLPPSGGEPNFGSALAAWSALAPLREFELRSSFPLFPYRLQTANGAPPPGFSVRIRPTTVADCGGSTHTLAAAGICPFIANPFREHCVTEARRLEQWASDLPALVTAKWKCFLAG